MDDLGKGIKNLLLKFADNTKLGGRIRGPGDVERLQSDIDSLVDWSEQCLMKFNVMKCKTIHIVRNNGQVDYKITRVKLEKTNEEKISVSLFQTI